MPSEGDSCAEYGPLVWTPYHIIFCLVWCALPSVPHLPFVCFFASGPTHKADVKAGVVSAEGNSEVLRYSQNNKRQSDTSILGEERLH